MKKITHQQQKDFARAILKITEKHKDDVETMTALKELTSLFIIWSQNCNASNTIPVDLSEYVGETWGVLIGKYQDTGCIEEFKKSIYEALEEYYENEVYDD